MKETDKQYIRAFLSNDQRLIRRAYEELQRPFLAFIRSHTPIREDFEMDAYQEAFIRMQQNILYGRLTEDNLSTSLLGYLEGIGYNTAMELCHADKETPISLIERPEEHDTSGYWDVPDVSDWGEACSPEDMHDPLIEMEEKERERIIREQVMLMGTPCSPLLLGYYWDNKSMQQLAKELGYWSADTAKNQKARCMKKLTTFVTSKLRLYGYER